MELCEHCGLPVGRFGHAAEAAGESKSFCCYGCFVAWQAAHGGGDDSVAVGFLIRLGVGAFLTMNIMLFSLLLYSGSFDEGTTQARFWLHWLLFLLATPAVIILGGPFLRESIAGLYKRQLVPAMLITIGAGSAYIYSSIATALYMDRVYFDTAAMVLLLFTLGRYLEANARARAARSLKPMLEARFQRVTRVVDHVRETVTLADITCGNSVSILPGERIPVDGIVTSGKSQANESTLSGEPHPVEKEPGSSVLAGSINGDCALTVEATADGLESQWLTICHDVRVALATPTRSQLLAEKAMVAFIPVVIALALVAVWLNWETGSGAKAMLAGLAVLVVACPCALGLAAPLATSMAIARLLDGGILVRNGAALETLSALRTLCFDKTGTLTAGNITCENIIGSDPDVSAEEAVRLAASVAHASKHPLSISIVQAAKNRNIAYAEASDIEVEAGGGVTGESDGKTIYLGSARWFKKLNIPVVHTVSDAAELAAEQGRMLAYLAWDGVCRTALVFCVGTHPESGRVTRAVENQHIDVCVLTGDGTKQTSVFCNSLGISSWLAELTPDEKRNTVAEFTRKRAPVAMVGDGVNDALAIAAADVGIAVGDATALARESADVVLQSHSVSQLLPLLATARIARKAIATNLCWAFGYNVVALVMAASGILQPVIAAGLMAGSSLVVVLNTQRCLGSIEVPGTQSAKHSEQRKLFAT